MIDSLITFLDSQLKGYYEIKHAFDLDPVEKKRNTLPALYLWPGTDEGSGDSTDTYVSKRLRRTAHIHLVCKIEELETRLAELRTKCIGWNAGAGYDDLEHEAGRVVSLKGGVIWWEETYFNFIVVREAYS